MKRFLFASLMLPGFTAGAAEPAGVMVDNGHIRALPPTIRNTAAYFTVHNQGTEAVTLTGARTDIAAKAELHATMSSNGMLMMHEADPVTIPAMGSVTLENGGLHLMLMGLVQPLAPGQEVSLVLEFADGSELPVQLPVMTPMAGGLMEHEMDHDQD